MSEAKWEGNRRLVFYVVDRHAKFDRHAKALSVTRYGANYMTFDSVQVLILRLFEELLPQAPIAGLSGKVEVLLERFRTSDLFRSTPQFTELANLLTHSLIAIGE
jgi:hypothetical protein